MDTPLSVQVDSIRATLYAIETQLDRGRIPPQALGDFKAAVDDIRLRIWSIMAASKSADPRALERFRIRRATEITRSLTAELRSASVQPDHPELQELRQSAMDLLAVLTASRPTAQP